jgi:hypothetical protein
MVSIEDPKPQRAKKNLKSFLKKEFRDQLPNFFFNHYPLEDKFILNFYCETTYYNYKKVVEPLLKQKISSIDLKGAKVNFDEFAWISYPGFRQALEKGLIPWLCNCILDFKELSNSWSLDSSIEASISLQTGFLIANKLDKNEINAFYNWYFNEKLESIETQEGRDLYLAAIVEELDKNFQEQKDMMTSFFDTVTDGFISNRSFDDQWINNWFDKCKLELDKIERQNHPIIVDFDFKHNPELSFSAETQKKWVIYGFFIDYLLVFLNIEFIYQLNLIYAIKTFFNEQQKANTLIEA